MNKIYLLLIAILLIACNADKEGTNKHVSATSAAKSYEISYKLVPPASSGLQFQNNISESPRRNVTHYDYMYNGGGVAVADFDNDGLTDIFLCGNDSPNAIYKNTGKLNFKDLSASALPSTDKWSFGVTTVDINNDGYLDLYVSNSGPDKSETKLANQLLVNNGDFTFTDRAAEYGLASTHHSVQASFFDYDNDGDLDMWLNNHGNAFNINEVIKSQGYNDIRKGDRLALLKNDKSTEVRKSKIQLYQNNNGKFTDVSNQAGVAELAYGLGLCVADFNDDGHLDVYVANDYWVPDYYFINNGNGTFSQQNTTLGHTSYYSMGCDAADYNNDGQLDLMVVDMTPKDHYRNKTLMESMDVRRFTVLSDIYKYPRQYMFNTFQVGLGNGQFGEIANLLDVGLTEWSWAPLMYDMNNDGHKDIYVTNGYYRDTKNQDVRRQIKEMRESMGSKYTSQINYDNLELYDSQPIRNAIFQNDTKGMMRNITSSMSGNNPSFSNGAAYADFDNDGDLDLIVNNLSSPATLIQNNSSTGNYLRVKLNSKNPALNANAKILVHAGNNVIRGDYYFTRGYLSSVEPIAHFGLHNNAVDSLIVEWKDGRRSIISNPPINQIVTINHSDANGRVPSKTKTNSHFLDATLLMERQNIIHKENAFDDFEKEVLLPQKFSTMGPAMSVADINNDGSEDFYIGGANGSSGKLMVMSGNKFQSVSESTFAGDANFEDLGAQFFDYNNDGQVDLYVASGGGGDVTNSVALIDRLYTNNGNGQFSRDVKALPPMKTSTSAIVPFDFDKDGDMDLFIGGRNKPGKYPSKSTSYLLENNGNKYTRRESSFLNQLPNMVTDAEVCDINGDGYPDLFITGEWSTPMIFINDKSGEFNQKNIAALDNKRGWWYSITKGDFNNDGKLDFILGNLGLNNKFHANHEHPLGLLYNDFDDNGSQDIVLTKHYKGETVPVRGKECSSEQMPFLNKKFDTYSSFASSNISEILGANKVNSAPSLEANYFSSVLMMSNGNDFQVIDLPLEAQYGPILDAVVVDINNDNHQDVVIAGKIVNTEPETPSYDGNNGLILFGNGTGQFFPLLDQKTSGLNLNYNTKQIDIINRQRGYGVIVANNNGPVQLFIKS